MIHCMKKSISLLKNFSFLITFIVFVLQTRPVLSQSPSETSADHLEFSAKEYKVIISKDPFRMMVKRGSELVARLDGIISEDTTSSSQSVNVQSWVQNEEKLNLVISASDGSYYSAKLIFNDNSIQFFISSTGRETLRKIGLIFNTQISGHWYGGSVVTGHHWPLEKDELEVDPFYSASNQVSPIWYASKGVGLIVPTYDLMGYSFNVPEKGLFRVYSKKTDEFIGTLVIGRNIIEAFNGITKITGKPANVPIKEFFKYPQFNTWIEFLTKVNQPGIEKYTHEIKTNDFPSSIFIIDDKWTKTYGDFEFDFEKFPNPSGMIETLHKRGLKVALWITPFIEKAAANYSYARDNNFLIRNLSDDSPYMSRWWNGQAAIIDLSNPEAYKWFLGMLKNLQKKYGVDGFKLDAGDANFLMKPYRSYGKISPNEYTDLFAGIGANFELNELRVSWMTQSLGLVQRLRDKGPNWTKSDGIKSLVPHGLTASLLGYSFVCPDLIGGGLEGGFTSKDYKFDEELFVRWAEASSMMPMMQYSLAPWRLSKGSLAICRKYSELHVSLGDYIYSLAQETKKSGTPVIRPLFFEFPDDEKCYLIEDEFMLGNRFLVAPVLEKGAVTRSVYLPEGTWIDYWTKKIYSGEQAIEYPAPLDILPLLINIDN